jgi:hypothetical protein
MSRFQVLLLSHNLRAAVVALLVPKDHLAQKVLKDRLEPTVLMELLEPTVLMELLEPTVLMELLEPTAKMVGRQSWQSLQTGPAGFFKFQIGLAELEQSPRLVIILAHPVLRLLLRVQ